MSRILTTRRSEWFPAVKTLAAAVGIAAITGLGLGSRSWVVYVGLLAGALLAIGWLERYWIRRAAIASVRGSATRKRSKLRVIPGGKSSGGELDLETDDTTDSQRWLM